LRAHSGIRAASGTPTAGERSDVSSETWSFGSHAAHQGGRLDDLAALVVAAVPLHGVGHVRLAKRGQVDVEVAPAAQEDAEVPPGHAALVVLTPEVARERARLELGCLERARAGNDCARRVARPGDPVLDCRVAPVRSGRLENGAARDQRLERRLHALDRNHHGPHHTLDLCEDLGDGAEVHGEGVNDAVLCLELLAKRLIRSQVRRAPAVDGLLRVPHDEETRALPGGALEGQDLDQPALHVVGVLELVHEELVDVAPHARRDVGFVLEQVPRIVQQVDERDDAARAQLPAHLFEQRPEDATRELGEPRTQGAQALQSGQHPARSLRELRRAISQARLLAVVELRGCPLGQALDAGVVPDLAQSLREAGEILDVRDRDARRLQRLHEGQGHLGGLAADRLEAPLRGLEQALRALAQLGQRGANARWRERVRRERGRGRTPLDQREQGGLDLGRADALAREREVRPVALLRVRLRQLRLESLAHHLGLERAVGVDLERGVQSRLERVGGQQPPAEGVDGAHDQVIERAEQRACPLLSVRHRREDLAIDPLGLGPPLDLCERLTDAAGHLRGGRLGERDGDDAAEHLRGDLAGRAVGVALLGARPARAETPGDDARDQGRGLARAGPRLDQERVLELALRSRARFGVARTEVVGDPARRHGVASLARSGSRHTPSSARSAGSAPRPSASSSARTQSRSRARTPESPRKHASATSQYWQLPDSRSSSGSTRRGKKLPRSQSSRIARSALRKLSPNSSSLVPMRASATSSGASGVAKR
jgi:hypothetical protein